MRIRLCIGVCFSYMAGMDAPPKLTDRKALRRNRARADGTAMFLQELAADDVQERLIEVNRAFTAPAIITGFPDFWANVIPNATIVEDTDVLALTEASHDLVIHALCLHWADDPIGQLVQSRRALKPDGLFIGTTFAGQTLHELRAALAEGESHVTGGLSPRVLPMGDLRDLGGLLQRACFALPVADTIANTVTYETPLHLMRDLRAMGEANAMAQRNRSPLRRNVLFKAIETYQSAFGTDDGRIPATFEIATLTGWAPADSQPKPLRPGSATTRLSDALGVTEHPLKRSND